MSKWVLCTKRMSTTKTQTICAFIYWYLFWDEDRGDADSAYVQPGQTNKLWLLERAASEDLANQKSWQNKILKLCLILSLSKPTNWCRSTNMMVILKIVSPGFGLCSWELLDNKLISCRAECQYYHLSKRGHGMLFLFYLINVYTVAVVDHQSTEAKYT